MNRCLKVFLVGMICFPIISQNFTSESIATKYNLPLEQVDCVVNRARESMRPKTKVVELLIDGHQSYYHITRTGVGILETVYGNFYLLDFEVDDVWKHYYVLIKGTLGDDFMPTFERQDLLNVRIDSGCATGQLFVDQTCDCKEQLMLAMTKINEVGEGIIICIPAQDGRGMGLAFKLATLSLQHDLGINTVESANLMSENSIIDVRTYQGAIGILDFLGIDRKTKICLATNNPKKVDAFITNGYIVEHMVPVIIQPNEHTKKHLEAKRTYLGHIL
jgi:GTP cyclohydrolase II